MSKPTNNAQPARARVLENIQAQVRVLDTKLEALRVESMRVAQERTVWLSVYEELARP